MDTRMNYSGFVIAGIGFFTTRFTVTLAIYEEPIQFYLGGIVPLALGLGLAAFGMALAVADVKVSLVRTTALWCVIGFVTMFALVVLTILGSSQNGFADFATTRSQTYLSNFLIGGSIGGTLTGLYASRTQQQRSDLQQQANRLVVFNRLLRHEVLNAVSIIQGYATANSNENLDATKAIEESSLVIEQTIEEVKFLSQQTNQGKTPSVPVSLEECLRESISTVTDQHPNANVSVGNVPENLTVRANNRLPQVFTHLIDNSIVHAVDDNPVVTVTEMKNSVRVSVADEGPGLPENQQHLLETGDIEEFDDPTAGFGLNVVRLLVESYEGRIETEVTENGTTVTVVLPKVEDEIRSVEASHANLAGVRLALPSLLVTLLAALIAGVLYGITSEALGGAIAGIGVFYGTANQTVGWITHEFHSVVFGFVFVSLVSLAPEQYRESVFTYAAIGIGWALVLWIVAAGVIAPIWLRLLGIPASLPNISFSLMLSHLVWGLSLGVFTAWGYKYVLPWVARIDEQLRRRVRNADRLF
ncbi:ATP-binding protein [Natrinema halophilum]|uniref:histidine kinase n=1 Tax=Natrinema halophilum TaxID=1699371 RepID=A0A7D5GK98_9EURY|nr:ATP-binding protein [Natrinema halophilum]QLG51228.1 ATP-binding protein [Natrinema halophilum]